MRARLLLPAALVTALLAPSGASASVAHTVLPGESLSSIAAQDGLSVAQLAAANGLPANAWLTAGSAISIPPQGSSSSGVASAASTGVAASGAAASGSTGAACDGDGDSDDVGCGASAAAAAPASASSAGGSYVVQPGDTLSAIAARAGMSVAQLAAANGLNPSGLLLSGSVLRLSGAGGSVASGASGSVASPPPSQAPAVGTTITGRMTWFGGPHDPSAQGAPASGLGWRSDGMSFYNYGSLGHQWVIRFPWGQVLNMTQIDIGPAPWTGNPFDIAFSAIPNTPYSSSNWPNPIVTGTYQGG
ncbi:MAG: LysM peptidoglycan-binding domain-containing protein [Solirubrobacterales bacterium]|nr:LysM peptidoglycan-binding domain-containing protein [Solirubrobacterales bacterium]